LKVLRRNLESGESKEKMSTNRYLGGNAAATRPEEQPGKFTSRWAIPRVEPQVESNPKRKKWQINNIVLLFVIYVFKQAKKLSSSGSKRA
jgi:hypothetical protein